MVMTSTHDPHKPHVRRLDEFVSYDALAPDRGEEFVGYASPRYAIRADGIQRGPGLRDDIERLGKALTCGLAELADIENTLFGPQPEPGKEAGVPPPAASLSDQIRHLCFLAERLQATAQATRERL